MRRDGRSSGAGFPVNRSGKHISRDRRNNRKRVSLPRPEQGAESLRRERFRRSLAGRGQKGRAAFTVDRSWKRWNRRQELRRVLGAATGVRPARGLSENRSREYISRNCRNNRQRVSVPRPEQWAESLRRERIPRSQAGRGQKGRAAFPVDRSWKRRNRRQELRRV